MQTDFLEWQYAEGCRARIRYVTLGKAASQPPLLFIHGYGAMIEHWKHNLPYFALAQQVFAMDLLGFGQSDKPPAMYGLPLWAEQIHFFLETLRLPAVVLVGHSMGGAACLWFAHHFPKQLSALVLVNASGIFPDEVSPIEKLLYRAVGSPLIGEAMFGLFANSFGAQQSLVPTYYDVSKVTDELVEQFAQPLRSNGAMYAYLAPSRYPERFVLTQLPRPCHFTGRTLIVWGKYDRAFPPEKILPKFLELLPQAQSVIIDRTRHCPHDEDPDTFNAALSDFLAAAAD
ncbi:MAG: alpha/beta fold hydrolase [Chloroherpetonaceae bacterium]|nr:alpha/beta fold hydrolase [Chloroherpetonaceae bacterium]